MVKLNTKGETNMKVFLTGATGLLGGHIVEELLRKQYEVTALVRSLERGKKLLPETVTLAKGDLKDITTFQNELENHDILIHAGACYSEYYRTGKKDELTNVNVRGTKTIIETAYLKGIKNLIFISSAAVLETESNNAINELNAYSQTSEPYFKSKVEAEKEIIDFSKKYQDLRLITILPSVMMGPGDRGPTPNGKFILNYLHDMYKFIIPGSNCIADVRDVAQTIVTAIKKGSHGERYVVGGRKHEYKDIFKLLSEVSGKSALTKTITFKKLLMVSRVVTLINTLKGKPSPLKPAIVKRLNQNFWYDTTKAEKELGTTYRPLKETLKDTVQWFKEHNYA